MHKVYTKTRKGASRRKAKKTVPQALFLREGEVRLLGYYRARATSLL
jgi:hypothetical protein